MARKYPQSDEENQLGNGSDNEPTRPHHLDDLILAARPELLSKDRDGNAVLNVAVLQRMVLFQRQIDIITKVGPLASRRFGGQNPLSDPELRKDLAEYVHAIRDWEVMIDHQLRSARVGTSDPFHISSNSRLVKKSMEENGLMQFAGDLTYQYGTLDKEIGTFGQRNKINKKRAFQAVIERFIMAVGGGISLVAPMIFMVYYRNLAAAVAMTSVAVIIFSGVMAVYSNGASVTIVGTVAAYAAVLVVFVGTLQNSYLG